MTISWRAHSTDGDTGTDTLTLANPTGLADGDMMIAVVSSDGAQTWAEPIGWNELKDAINAGNDISVAVFWREASSETGTDFVASGTTTLAGQLFAFSHDTGTWDTPVAADINFTANTTNTNTTNALTSASGDAMVCAWINDGAQAESTPTPVGMTATQYLTPGTLGHSGWYQTGLSGASETRAMTFGTNDEIGSAIVMVSDSAGPAATSKLVVLRRRYR